MLRESYKLTIEGIAAIRAHRQLEAEALFTDALTLDPDNADAWLWRARAAPLAAERESCYAHVLRINPGSEEARATLRAAQYPDGARAFDALIARARKHQQAGAHGAAFKVWREVLEFDPVNEEAVCAVMALLEPRHPKQARALLVNTLKRNPHNATLALQYAAYLADAGDRERAARVLDRVDPRGLHTADGLTKFGQMCLTYHRADAALKAFETAVDLPDCGAEAYYALGTLYEQLDDTDRAVEAYRHVVEMAWGTAQADAAERRLRAISPYLPRRIADSWAFILREAGGWVIFVALLAIFDNGMHVVGMSTSGVMAIALSLLGGVCWAVGGISYGTLHLLGPRVLGRTARQGLQVGASVVFVAALWLSMSNSITGALDYLAQRFG